MTPRRKLAAELLVVMMAFSLACGALVLPSSASGPPLTLAVQVAPGVLPADGGTYPAVYVYLLDSSGSPTLAAGNVTVYLTSSTPAVGVVLNSSLTIDEGKGYAVADFQSSPTIGTTLVTASASGFTTGSAKVSTAVPRGYPTAISLTPVPSEVNSTSTSLRSGKMIVELLDQAGDPAKTAVDTAVSVYSSSPKILSLNETSFTMQAGQLMKVLSFSTGFIPGSATVVASAPQLASGSAQVTVLGRPPLALALYAQPDTLVTAGTGRLVIALTDLKGNPVRAPAATEVQLRSSADGVVSVPASVTIPAGDIYTTVVMAAGISPSSDGAVITASSSGLQSGFVQVPVADPSGTPVGLKLYVGPGTVLADHGNYSSVVVSLVDAKGNPAEAPSGESYDVILTSSHNSSVGEFGQSSYSTMSITEGMNYLVWVEPFTSTFEPGTTGLTVSAQNLTPATGSITTVGSVPSKVVVSPLFSSIPADGGSHPSLEVSLEDSSGGPAVASSPVTVYLSSSQSGIAHVDSPLVINAGVSAVVVDVRSTSVGGAANITAYTDSLTGGYSSSSTSIVTSTPSPSAVTAYIAPAVFAPSPDQNSSVLVIQLQDSSGNPAKARVPTTLTITSSNTAVVNGTIRAQVPQGASFVDLPISPVGAGKAVLTVTSPGLAPATLKFQSEASPVVARMLASTLSLLSDQQATVTVSLTIDGEGVGGANVSWGAVGGVVSANSSLTDAQGRATVVFSPTQLGVASVSANVSSRYTGAKSFSTPILVSQAPHPKGLASTLLSFPYILVIVGAAAAVVVLVIVVFRRRRRATEAEGELVDEEQGFSFYRWDGGRRGTPGGTTPVA